ncbi:MAG: catalase/peroxidase HPI [Cellvibrionaceae bacterium]|nr:catalase/peroxidase HPI [Cellvibrionaceae bacterium]
MKKNKIKAISSLSMALLAFSISNNPLANTGTTNDYWWPDQLDLSPLRIQSAESNPYGEDFDYAAEFKSLDLAQVKADITALMKDSQDWWPADYGHYGPFFIRMAWHSAGVYRIFDGRGGAAGGQQRFEPLNSWPDNQNLDKARRLLWPIKQKYGRKISWADLMVLTGNVALESMGFKTFGFAGGREDDWEAEQVDWGAEKKWLDAKRYSGDRDLAKPYGAVQMGLIYVNPEGPNANHDPVSAARDIRETFGRMAMNDEETVALIAGGHTFGKAHGAVANDCVGAEPAAGDVEAQGLGWKNKCGSGNGKYTHSSGLEGAWTSNPIAWTTQYLDNLFNFEWVQSKSPAGATQWVPKDADKLKIVPDAHESGTFHAPIMFTTDLSLKMDPSYRKIAMRFKNDPNEYQLAFAKAWFKLTHRDMGPRARYLGSEVPAEDLIWQDPLPKPEYAAITARDVKKLKQAIADSGLSSDVLVRTAWASAASFRRTDLRGGTDGGRLRLAPQNNWSVNNPSELKMVLSKLEGIQQGFNEKSSRRKVSLADLIVLGGAVGIEQSAKKGGMSIDVPFKPGRVDALPKHTDASSFAVLEPQADGFRNYFSKSAGAPPTRMLVDRADMLDLSVPEMTVLVGGMRALNANSSGIKHGVFTDTPGVLSNDFFVNLLDMSTEWVKSKNQEGVYEGRDLSSGKVKWTATPIDLVFGSHAELRAVSEVYGSNDAKEKFMDDFVAAWTKVMNLGRS